jgi:hypothetical protein
MNDNSQINLRLEEQNDSFDDESINSFGFYRTNELNIQFNDSSINYNDFNISDYLDEPKTMPIYDIISLDNSSNSNNILNNSEDIDNGFSESIPNNSDPRTIGPESTDSSTEHKSKDDFEPISYEDLYNVENLEPYIQIKSKFLSPEDIKEIQDEVYDGCSFNDFDHREYLKLKRNRKKEQKYEKHSKLANDNIIRKIKTLIINMIRESINNTFGSKILDNAFEVFKNVLDTESNRKFIFSPIYKLFEGRISSKYKIKNYENYNKEQIINLLKNHPEAKEYLNKNFHEYLDIIRNGGETTLQNFPKIEELIRKIENKNQFENPKKQSKYIIKFLLLLYNYERYYYAKSKRRHQRKEKNSS